MPTIFDTKPKAENTPIKRPRQSFSDTFIPTDKQSNQPAEANPESHAFESVNRLLHGPRHSMGIFTSYATHPKGVSFANQEPDETILLFLRRHFITNVPWILLTLLLSLIPPLLLFLISLIPSLTIPLGLLVILTGFYYLLVISYSFGKFISWFYNIGVVTQKRIVDLDSTNILAHNTATANFNEIVDVKFNQNGFFQSTFDYGNIHIQTEAIRANFEFDAAPKPTIVTDIISDLRVAQKGNHHGHS